MRKILVIGFILLGISGFAQKSGKYTVKNLGINTNYSDFGTSFYKNKQVIFSSPKNKTFWSTLVKDYWKQNKQRFLDLYVTDMDIDGDLIDKKPFNEDVNSKYHESNLAFTNDFNTVFFTRNNYYNNMVGKDSTGMSNLAIYKAEIDENGKWNISEMPFNSKEYSVGHPTLSADNKKLYFVSDMPGGKGKSDIYVVDILEDNTYSQPINISEINTKGREMFPFMSKNGILYYSTDGPNETKGLDVFAYNFLSAPVKLDKPLNSAVDDFAFIIDSDKNFGYFSSNRSGGKGDDDIYYFTQDEPIEFDCKQYILVKIVDSETLQPLNGAKLFVFHNGVLENESVYNDNNPFKTDTKCKEDFEFKSSMEGYENFEYALKTSERNEYTNNVVLSLKQIKKPLVDTPRIILGPVRFDYDKYKIRNSQDADIELDRIVEIMNQYPEMIVSIESFTDTRGDIEYNYKLSQNRADETKKYLIKKGISENRIVGVKGRGEEMPMNHCTDGTECTDEEHQINRRTEFVIVNPESYQKQ